MFIEAQRCIVRLLREKILSPDESEKYLGQIESDVNTFVTRDVTVDLCVSRTYPAICTPRSSDLIHLRSALWFRSLDKTADCFVTNDTAQKKAAVELGLQVI